MLFSFSTKLFIRFPKTLFNTEDAFQEKKNDIAAIIQSHWKGLMQRRRYVIMRRSAIVIQKWVRRFLAQRERERRKKAAMTIRKFIKGFITRNGPPNEDNKNFIEIAKSHWLKKLATSLPKHVLDKSWPPCPFSCKEASEHLHRMHCNQLARKYRLSLNSDKKKQLEMKVVAESLFKGKINILYYIILYTYKYVYVHIYVCKCSFIWLGSTDQLVYLNYDS